MKCFEYKLKRDKYRKARGGVSIIYLIKCAACGNNILVYQKDGSGILKRLYLDRIFKWQQKNNNFCQKCGVVFGNEYIYEKENRPAIRLYAGAIKKQRV
jgi:hypothetical protein